MEDLFKILPEAMLYLACGYTFLCGFYMLSDKRFDFFSEISFWIMLVLGFLINTAIAVIPINTGLQNQYVKNGLHVIAGFIAGILIAVLRNCFAHKLEKIILKLGRRKTASQSFWYDLLDEKSCVVWLRMLNVELGYYLDGALVAISEDKENPYILLGYCKKYNLEGGEIKIENVNANDGHVQKIVRADSFNEITVFYGENSKKAINLEIEK